MAAPTLPIFALCLAALYLRGLLYRRRRIVGGVTSIQALLFLSGVGVLLFATLPPLANLGLRLFWIDQAQHLVLRLAGPILIALAHPWPVLIAGLPRRVRRVGLRPVQTQIGGFSARRPVGRAALVLALFLAAIGFAQAPSIHNAALGVPVLRSGVHLALLVLGLLLFAILFDRGDVRDGVVATAQGARIYVLLILVLSNIILGALTTLKEVVVYTGYDANGRAALMNPLVDETVGGFTTWVPSSWLCILAIIIVFAGWNRAEERQYARRFDRSTSNSAALMFPETAEELRLKVADPNRKMARALGAGSVFIFLLVLSTAITIATFY